MSHRVFISLLTEASVGRITTLFLSQGWGIEPTADDKQLHSCSKEGAPILALCVSTSLEPKNVRDKIADLLDENQVPHHGIVVVGKNNNFSWHSGNTNKLTSPQVPGLGPYRSQSN